MPIAHGHGGNRTLQEWRLWFADICPRIMSKGGAENPITNANGSHSSFMEIQVLTDCVVKLGENLGPSSVVWSFDRLESGY